MDSGVTPGLKETDWLLQLSYNRLEDHTRESGGDALMSPYGNDSALYISFITNDFLSFGPGCACTIGAPIGL